MGDIHKLHLEEALDDSPQTRSLLGVFEKDSEQLRGYFLGLQKACQRIMNAQVELTDATRALSSHLKAYRAQKFPLESDDSILTATLQQFTNELDELSSVHQVQASQYGDSMMFPLNRFIQADLDEVRHLSEMFKMSSNDVDQSQARFMKLPKKKLSDQAKQEANEDLFVYRKKFHQTALHYYSSLNALQYKRKTALLEPLIGYLHAQRSYFQMGKETTSKPTMDDFLSNINASVQGVHADLAEDTTRTVEMMKDIEQGSLHLYAGEPPPAMPEIPMNNALTQKAGYLYMRSSARKVLIATRWDKYYFFIQAGNLMCQPREDLAGSLIVDLNDDGVHAEAVDTDDRRFTFQVICPKLKKTVILQAENEREKDEWICTIENAISDSAYAAGHDHPVPMINQSNQQFQQSHPPTKSMAVPNVVSAVKEAQARQAAHHSTSGPPPTPPSTPTDGGGFHPDAPIQFDIIPPSPEALEQFTRSGPPGRINPFDQSTVDIHNANPNNAAFCQTFIVRFCGSMEVRKDRGEQLVLDTIRQIMAARAIHNVFKMQESHFIVSSDCVRLLDPANNVIRTAWKLEDISFWAPHNENKRLFGFVTRNKSTEPESKTSFACHVFESNNSSEDICHAISTATKLAFQALLEKKQQEKELNILLANIDQLEDVEDGEDGEKEKTENGEIEDLPDGAKIEVTDKGKFLVLNDPPPEEPTDEVDNKEKENEVIEEEESEA